MIKLELVVRYLGYGERCSHCGKVRETTRYTLRQGETQLQQFKLCDACQDSGFAIAFHPKPESTVLEKDRKRRVKISRKLERNVAEDIQGTTTPGSGNRDTKADIRKFGEWRIEHKYTGNTSVFRLLVEDLRSIIHHANRAGEWPAMVINFQKLKRQFAVLPYELFVGIVEELSGRTH
jgi:hypothetical protein